MILMFNPTFYSFKTFSVLFSQEDEALERFSSVQFSRSVVSTLVTPWTAAHQASLPITNSWSLLKLMSIEFVMPSNHLILCRPLLPPPSVFPSIRVFSSESARLIRWPRYWSFSFSVSPSNEYSGLISFRMDRLDLLAVQRTLKSLLQRLSTYYLAKYLRIFCCWLLIFTFFFKFKYLNYSNNDSRQNDQCCYWIYIL